MKELTDPLGSHPFETIHDEILLSERFTSVEGIGPLRATLEQREYKQQSLADQILEIHFAVAGVLLQKIF